MVRRRSGSLPRVRRATAARSRRRVLVRHRRQRPVRHGRRHGAHDAAPGPAARRARRGHRLSERGDHRRHHRSSGSATSRPRRRGTSPGSGGAAAVPPSSSASELFPWIRHRLPAADGAHRLLRALARRLVRRPRPLRRAGHVRRSHHQQPVALVGPLGAARVGGAVGRRPRRPRRRRLRRHRRPRDRRGPAARGDQPPRRRPVQAARDSTSTWSTTSSASPMPSGARRYPSLVLDVDVFPDEFHATVAPIVLNRGLRALLGPA